MLSHTGTLWHYLGSFILYTLLAIGLIYGAYCYARKSSASGKSLMGFGKKPDATEVPKLTLESTLALEPRKTLYVVASGHERFLIAASGETTQLVSKLENTPQPVDAATVLAATVPADVPPVKLPEERPWYTDAPIITRRQKASFGMRFVQSVQWLVSSRSGK